jgi:phenylalanyl-tRNA synthetase alpha chain
MFMVADNLVNTERRMLKAMLAESTKLWSLSDILTACDWQDQAIAVGAGLGIAEKGYAEVSETVTTEVKLGAQGHLALSEGLLEARLWDWIKSTSDPSMANLQQSFERHEAGPGIGLLKKLGVAMDGGSFTCANESEVTATISARQDFLSKLPAVVADLDDVLLNHFKNRRNFIEFIDTTTRTWMLTEDGTQLDSSLLIETTMINEITPELLQSETWKDADYRRFDVTLESATPRTGRSHPMQSLIERIRHIFLEMGFSEIVEDYVQTAGWNMDALFIPQDHPAREMQDTFYLDNPKMLSLPDDVMAKWSDIHRTGGDTGSTGWGGEFSKETSQKGLLRTHTTVNTIQYLAENPDMPCRMFAVDRVFRKEAIDRTHLPEFHQIEGIIMEEGANLQMLVATLKTFYAKMGYPEVRVRPAYFPYTEPSLEIEVKWRGKWLELGGAGIFRPEVTEPLGIKHPVLAWGMGLERLAMLVLGLDDIRQLYISDLEWLRNQPLI